MNFSDAALALHQTRCIGSLLGTAVGDILGANIEFFSRSEILQEHCQVVDFLDSPARPMGMFTDDPEMTIALASSLVACGSLDGHHCAMAYSKAFIAEPRRGYDRASMSAIWRADQQNEFRQWASCRHWAASPNESFDSLNSP